MDLFVVPTISFQLLYGFLILQHGRREILWIGTTAHPNADWIARQLTEAFGWEHAPRYIIRDRDRAYGDIVVRRLRAMGIRDRPTSPRSPWQNGYCERLIGSADGTALTMLSYLASGIFGIYFDLTQTTTILHHNTHLSMWLKKRDFADRDAIPWGILDFGGRVL
jgi:transposase InsO family protein